MLEHILFVSIFFRRKDWNNKLEEEEEELNFKNLLTSPQDVLYIH